MPSGIVFHKGAVRPAVPAAAAVRPQQWNHRWIKEDSTEVPMTSVHGFIRCFLAHLRRFAGLIELPASGARIVPMRGEDRVAVAFDNRWTPLVSTTSLRAAASGSA